MDVTYLHQYYGEGDCILFQVGNKFQELIHLLFGRISIFTLYNVYQ